MGYTHSMERAGILMRLYSGHRLRQAGFQRKKRGKQSMEGLGVERRTHLDRERTPNLGRIRLALSNVSVITKTRAAI